ncbi:MAG: hypothetical protein KF774_01000 [Planctomyces sp.]|nr:hypothetical protein [Planctomyces sp.]
MQRRSKLTLAVAVALIALCSLALRKTARAWQAPAAGQNPPVAQPTPEPDPVESAEAVALVQAARDQLSQWRSVSATIIERVDIGDRRFRAEGRYIAGEFPRTRLEYEVTVGNTVGSLLEVCDGQVLHILRTIERAAPDAPKDGEESSGDGRKPVIEAVRRDVQQILRAAPNARNAALPIHAADLGLGGVPAVLAALEHAMTFESLREETVQGQAIQIVQGRWKPDVLARLNQQMGSALRTLDGFMPDAVRIEFDRETKFPMRFAYLQRASAERKTYRPMLILEFRDVEFDVDLPADTFAFQLPPGVEEGDDTAAFIQLLQGPPVAPNSGGTGRGG